MFTDTNEILKIVQNRMDKKDKKFNKLFENKELLENPAFNEIIHEINTYHAELIAQNEELNEKEQLLLKSKNELKTIFLESPLPYIVLDDKNIIVKYNNAAKELLELDDYKSFNMYRYLMKSNSIEEYTQFINDKYRKSHELKIIDSKNEEKYLEVFKVNTEIEYEKRILLSLKDITDLKKTQIIEDENKKLKSLNNLIDNIAHQWRQPLNLISLSASQLIFKYKESEDKVLLENIVNITQSLSQTINTFKDIINIDLQNKNKDLFNIVNEAIITVSSILSKNEIELINDSLSKEENTYKELFFNDFTKVLVIMFNNSIDAIQLTKPKNPWIKLNIDYLKFDKKILISLEDNGGGINDEIFDEIFEPYSTLKHQANGVGLNLYFAHEIITKVLKGNISVINTINGAKFDLEIPLNSK